MSAKAFRRTVLAKAAPLLEAGATALQRAATSPPAASEGAIISTDASYLQLIEAVSAAAAAAATVAEALEACVEGVCRWTGWPIGHVFLAGARPGDPLTSSGVWYLADPARYEGFRAATEATSLPPGVGLPGRVLASGMPAWITTVTTDPNFPRAAAAEEIGLRGAFSFPVPVAGGCFAVVECFSLQNVTPDPRLLEVTAHVGRQVGRVVHSMQTEEALRESEMRFRSVAESASDAIVAADRHGNVVSWNAGAESIFGYSEDEVVGRSLSLLMPERFRAMHEAGLARVAEHGPSASQIMGSTAEVVGLRKDGREFPLELSLATWDTPSGRFFSGIIRDITERKKAENKIRALLETAPDPIVEVADDGRVVLANARVDELFGYERSEIVGRPVENLFARRSREHAADRFRAALRGVDSPGAAGIELRAERKDGTEFPVDVTFSRLATEDGVVVTSIIRDVTERKTFEAQLKQLADHDALTGMFNRRRFEEELTEYVDHAARYKEEGAVLLLDLDRFKDVNDTYGHKAGDIVIREAGRILAERIRKSDVVARLGGDEFAVLLKKAGREEAAAVARAVVEALRATQVRLETKDVTVTTSIGIATFGDDEPVVEELMVCADLAMYVAKDGGGNRYEFASGGSEQLAGMQARLSAIDEIRRALDDEDRFVLYCQPIYDLRNERVSQYELLIRLRGDDGELVPPAAFIPTAERFGLIQEIDRLVIRRAIELLQVHRGLRLEVNLSGRSIVDPDLPDFIERRIAEAGIDPSGLVFEITETAAIANMQEARAFADRLTALGCRFALDDFGAGFSSFYYLKYLPLDYLKIDGDFVRGLTTSSVDQAVVKSMVDIARALGLATIAEFVEAAETAQLLQAKGVDYSQGYYHGVPRPVDEVLGEAAGGVAPAEIQTEARFG
jgi:diguanylate cyclase (GGDEF)-like protein/PAS domain S-box-containing protein